MGYERYARQYSGTNPKWEPVSLEQVIAELEATGFNVSATSGFNVSHVMNDLRLGITGRFARYRWVPDEPARLGNKPLRFYFVGRDPLIAEAVGLARRSVSIWSSLTEAQKFASGCGDGFSVWAFTLDGGRITVIPAEE